MHHRLHAGADRLKTGKAQQIQGGGPQRGHRAGAIAPVTVGVFMQLCVADPVPALNAPAVPHLSQQGFWRGAPAGEEVVGCVKWLAITGAIGGHIHDPAGAAPGLLDVLRRLFRPQRPGDVAAMADLVIGCHERDFPLALELAADVAVQRLLVGFDRQEEVGPLLLEELKNGRCVWSASAWINTPSRSGSPRSFLSTARSWFSPVA